MITEVSDKNVVTIPPRLASQHGIKAGSRLDWKETDQRDVLTVRILPDYTALATSLMGAGSKHLKPAAPPIADLADQRVSEDLDRESSL